MRITCPNCAAQYEVDAGLLFEDGRDVQCSACGHTWMQFGDGRVEEVADEDAEEPEAEADETDAAEEPDGEVTVARVPRRELDPDARRILREEAQREASRRRARRVTGIETQPHLGLEEEDAPATRDAAPASVVTAAPALGEQRHRRAGSGMFPDIEEINSTLSSSAEADRDRAEPASGSDAFRSGFLLMLALAVLIMALYLAAPWIAARVPALESALAAYVSGVNSFRMAVEELLQSAAEWIDNLSA